MSDIFQEVDEDLRRDRMSRLAKRYGGVIGAVAVLIVAATAGYQVWQGWRTSQREAVTGQLVNALTQTQASPAKGIEALSSYALTAPAELAVLAHLNEAALYVGEGKSAEAVAIYDSVAANAQVDVTYRDLAVLLSITQQIGGGDAAALQTRLQPLTADGNAWRFSAREMMALLAVRTGDTERARTLFQQLADDSLAPSGVRSRAAELAALYGKS